MKMVTNSLRYSVSKMANFASEPKHPPTIDRWEYGDGKTPHRIHIAMWNANGIRSILQKGKL